MTRRQIYAPAGAGNVVSFDPSTLQGIALVLPTTLDFGPDGRLYVAQQNGLINAYTIVRNGPQDYEVTATEPIRLVKENIANHDDDGAPNSGIVNQGGHDLNLGNTRQITGILVVGTPTNPVIYVSSSDPRHGAGQDGINDSGLDTNSGVVSRIYKDGGVWKKIDLVRGLPRSEENHSVNGMQIDEVNNILYLAVGGLTNAGSPSNNFARITEYALSAAILKLDLDAIDALPVKGSGNSAYLYDMPTLDDPTRANANGIIDPEDPTYNGIDVNDPFGGNNGLNQSKLVIGGPVQFHATGFRNPYDLVIMKSPGYEGKMYSIDNGANQGWGGHPVGEGSYPGGSAGQCTNAYNPSEPGSTGPGPNDAQVNNLNGMHYIRELEAGKPYYAGHPTPVRGNPAGAGLYTYFGGEGQFRTSKTGPNPLPADWPPVPVSEAYAAECDFRNSGVDDGSLVDYDPSTNGMAEYTASNFGGEIQGAILSAGYSGEIFIAKLNEAGNAVTNGVEELFTNFGANPLDVVAQGDDDVFPGTVWAVTYLEQAQAITVFEPVEGECAGGPGTQDDDNDGYSNDDEIDNGTNECSAADKPSDRDGDFVSDLNDSDDDNDGIADASDHFAIDAANGIGRKLPIDYDLFAEEPGIGFFGVGFMGLMTNGSTDYLDQFNPNTGIFGGTAGLVTIPDVSEGDAFEAKNSQQNAFQFGIDVTSATAPFEVVVSMLPPFFNTATPKNGQSHGFYIGTGDQDNYLKVVLAANGGNGGIEVVHEVAGTATSTMYGDNLGGEQNIPDDVLAASVSLNLRLLVDPAAGTALPGYRVDTKDLVYLGSPIPLSGGTLNALQSASKALAVGIISTSSGPGSPYTVTWDRIHISSVSATPSTLIRINAGSFDTIEINGITWEEDKYFTGGGVYTNAVEIAGTSADAIYQSERFDLNQAGISYSIPLPGNGSYDVSLHFAEIYFGAPGDGESRGGAGKRLFNVTLEGNEVLSDLDIYNEVGPATALIKVFQNVAVNDGAMDISITSTKDSGKLSAIEVATPGNSGPIANETGDEMPETFRLIGNYPNPFNPSTTIVFELPEPAQVTVEVYDVMGRKVLDVPAQNFASGTNQVRIAAAELASGIYLYRVVAQFATRASVRAGRMTFVK